MLDLDQVGAEVRRRAARVRLIVLDVDGVLTDGAIRLGADGEEGRTFYVRDGLGIRMGQEAGLQFAILSGRESAAVTRRATELGIEEINQRVLDKGPAFRELVDRLNVEAEATCFVGDDLIDLPAMRLAGLAVAPADADPETRSRAHYVTGSRGGHGAVREVIDLVLHASGKWHEVMGRFLSD